MPSVDDGAAKPPLRPDLLAGHFAVLHQLIEGRLGHLEALREVRVVMTSGGGASQPDARGVRAMSPVYPMLAVRGVADAGLIIRCPQPAVPRTVVFSPLPRKRSAALRCAVASGLEFTRDQRL